MSLAQLHSSCLPPGGYCRHHRHSDECCRSAGLSYPAAKAGTSPFSSLHTPSRTRVHATASMTRIHTHTDIATHTHTRPRTRTHTHTPSHTPPHTSTSPPPHTHTRPALSLPR